MNRFWNYIRDTKAELANVKWPMKSQAAGMTVLVIVVSLLTAALLGFFDYILSLIVQKFVI